MPHALRVRTLLTQPHPLFERTPAQQRPRDSVCRDVLAANLELAPTIALRSPDPDPARVIGIVQPHDVLLEPLCESQGFTPSMRYEYT